MSSPKWDILGFALRCGPMRTSLRGAIYSSVRRELIAERERAQLTQTELAKRLGRSQSFVAKYENGERKLDIADFISVCQALGVPASSLVAKVEQVGESIA